jgi:hypothetical protein
MIPAHITAVFILFIHIYKFFIMDVFIPFH